MPETNSAAGVPAAARTFVTMNGRITRRLRLEGAWLNIFDVEVLPGGGTPPHSHASPEIFRIIEGRLKIWRMTDQGPEETEVKAGDIVTIPAHAPHGYSNPGPAPAIFSAIVDADMAEFFDVLPTAQPAKGEPSADVVESVLAAADAHGITILAA